MKLSILLAYAGCFLRLAMASKVAGPWQLMMYYYTYKMHFTVYGADKNPYAPCKRSDGSMCDFDEFMEFARQKGKRLGKWPRGTISTPWGAEPDPKEVAPWMYNNVDSKYYAVALDPVAVYTKSTGAGQEYDLSKQRTSYPFPPQIKELNRYIDEMREKLLKERGKEIQDIPELAKAWEHFKTSVQGVSDMRRRDTWTKDLEMIKEKYRGPDYRVDPITKDVVSSVDSTKRWTEIDIEAIRTQVDGDKWRKALEPLAKFQAAETGLKHWPVIEQIDMLNGYTKVPKADLCANEKLLPPRARPKRSL